MNEIQKTHIQDMRSQGAGYTKIAAALGISENTVKSYCRRNGLGGVASVAPGADAECRSYCIKCGTLLVQTAGAKRKRFCSDKCRISWWNAHPEKLGSAREFVCRTCGKAFKSYGKRNRKYCSRACYGLSKAARS